MVDQPKRPVYLIVYPDPRFSAHWALFLPILNKTTNEPTNIGKLIQMEGSPYSGFQLDIQRRHDTEESSRSKLFVPLCSTNSENIVDCLTEEEAMQDINTPMDRFEEKAHEVPAPGKSLRVVSLSDSTRERIPVKNCQTWIWQFGVALEQDGVLEEEALKRLDVAHSWADDESLGKRPCGTQFEELPIGNLGQQI